MLQLRKTGLLRFDSWLCFPILPSPALDNLPRVRGLLQPGKVALCMTYKGAFSRAVGPWGHPSECPAGWYPDCRQCSEEKKTTSLPWVWPREHKRLAAHLPLEELLEWVCGAYSKCGRLAGMQTFFLRELPFLLVKLLTVVKKTPDNAFVEEEQWVSQWGGALERTKASICRLPPEEVKSGLEPSVSAGRNCSIDPFGLHMWKYHRNCFQDLFFNMILCSSLTTPFPTFLLSKCWKIPLRRSLLERKKKYESFTFSPVRFKVIKWIYELKSSLEITLRGPRRLFSRVSALGCRGQAREGLPSDMWIADKQCIIFSINIFM